MDELKHEIIELRKEQRSTDRQIKFLLNSFIIFWGVGKAHKEATPIEIILGLTAAVL